MMRSDAAKVSVRPAVAFGAGLVIVASMFVGSGCQPRNDAEGTAGSPPAAALVPAPTVSTDVQAKIDALRGQDAKRRERQAQHRVAPPPMAPKNH